MYQAHFGLKKDLFESGIAHEDAVFIGPRQQLVVANFKIALTTLDSAVLLTGPAGAGKTTLASAALRTTSTRLAVGWLGSAPASGTDLLESLLVEFGFNAHRTGRVERLQMWRQFLNEMNATDTRVFVLVERAGDLDIEVLRTLDAVTAADPNGCPGANLVLLGPAELAERLRAPALTSLAQRIRLRQRLEPFTAEELEAYLAHRVARAGGTFDKVFERDAIAALHRYSGGVPRVVNNLCETALTLAATTAEQRVSAQLVARVAVTLYGLEEAAASAVAVPANAETLPAVPPAVDPLPERKPGPLVAVPPTLDQEFPVLTDAIESTSPRPPDPAPARVERTPPKAARQEPPPTAPPPPPIKIVKQAPAAAPPPPSAVATRPAAVAAPPAPSKPAPTPRPARATAATPAPGDDGRETQTARKLATAQSLEQVTDSMAETLFDDADLDMLSAALASAGWDEDERKHADELLDDLARTIADDSVTMETPREAYASFGSSSGGDLELADESTPQPHRRAK
jgi:general secretion pathway protein A